MRTIDHEEEDETPGLFYGEESCSRCPGHYETSQSEVAAPVDPIGTEDSIKLAAEQFSLFVHGDVCETVIQQADVAAAPDGLNQLVTKTDTGVDVVGTNTSLNQLNIQADIDTGVVGVDTSLAGSDTIAHDEAAEQTALGHFSDADAVQPTGHQGHYPSEEQCDVIGKEEIQQEAANVHAEKEIVQDIGKDFFLYTFCDFFFQNGLLITFFTIYKYEPPKLVYLNS